MSIETIIGVIVGAAVAALFGIWQARYLRKREHEDRVNGLIRSLEGELAVIAELVAVDLDVDNIRTATQGVERLHRIAIARDVYEAAAGDLGILPESMPSAVVRCYGRLAAKADAMKEILQKDRSPAEGPIPMSMKKPFEEHRQLLSIEADTLLGELRDVLKSI